MQFFKSTLGGLLAVFILMIAILFVRQPKLFTAPNSWLINDTYDGFRSYSALVYHVRHDSTYSHYEGMNYPYGDKAAFTDNLPLIANSVKFISQNIVDISDYCAGILNGFLLLSVVLCAIFIYLIFSTLKLPVWYAIPVAIGITLLSPQLLRIHAHYGLAHPFVIPLMFWMSLLFHKNKRWSFSFLIAFLLFLCAQLHFYLFAIGGSFIIALMAFKTLFAFDRKALLINGIHLFIQVILPLIILQWLMYDNVPERPSRPYGFFAYKACWESVFLPVDFQLGRWINEYVYKIPTFDREGIAYIGLVPVLFIIKETIRKLWSRVFKNDYHTIIPDENRFFLKAAFWACFVILLFSLGLPFIIPGLEDFYLKLGPLAQFRSIGRFAWVFFYGFNIIAFYAVYYQVQKIRKRGWQAIVYTILIAMLLAEGGVFLSDKVALKLWPNPEIREDFQKSDNPWLETIKVEDYQAILTVPFFHTGSENIWISLHGKEMHRSMWLSVQTGLPINSSFMGRTSVNQVINQLELIAAPYHRPQILDDLPNNKDYLVFLYKKAYEMFKGRYEHLLQNLQPLFEDDQIQVYRLSIEELKNRIAKQAIETRRDFSNSHLYDFGMIKSTDSLRNFVYQNFDEQTAEKKYQGSGAYQQSGFPRSTLFDGHIPFQQTEKEYVFSVWAYVFGDLNPKVNVSLEEYQAGTNDIIYKQEYQLYKDYQAFDRGWMLSELSFRMKRPDSRLRVKVWNKDLGELPVFLDELQIRPKGVKLFLKDGKGMNCRWYGEEEN
ncbi:MAG: hypothetical protein ACI8P3_003193 [Saprospiraceae bacterium]|jgi:hypothetical protein